MKLNLYFFSGTGNARNVAHWIANKAKEYHYTEELFDLSKIDRKNTTSPEENTMLGFVAPTHGFNFPPVMINFFFRFPRTKFKNKIFIVNTRAGMKLGKIFVPGLSGIALWLATIVMWVKGYKIVGLRSVDLPSNWISLHPGLKENVIESIFDRCKKISDRFADAIFQGKRKYTAACDLLQDALIAPVSLAYYFFGRFIFAKSFYANSKCNNCNICITNCPVKAISIVSNKPYWSYTCESCMKCMNLCPQRAIETGHGFIIGTLVLANTTLVVWLWEIVYNAIQIPADSWGFKIIRLIIDTIIAFFMLLISYRVIHYLKKVVVFKQVIEYTSLTRYKFWRRYRHK